MAALRREAGGEVLNLGRDQPARTPHAISTHCGLRGCFVTNPAVGLKQQRPLDHEDMKNMAEATHILDSYGTPEEAAE